MPWGLFLASLACVPVLALAGCADAVVRRRLREEADWTAPAQRRAASLAIQAAFVLAPVASVAAIAPWRADSVLHDRPDGMLGHILLGFVFPLLLASAVYLLILNWPRGDARAAPRHLALSRELWRAATSPVLVGLGFLLFGSAVGQAGAGAPPEAARSTLLLLVLIVALWFLLVLAPRRLRPTRRMPVEDSPLLDELGAITRGLAGREARWEVSYRGGGPDPGGEGEGVPPGMLLAWVRAVRSGRNVIPAELVRGLDGEALTSAAALVLARRRTMLGGRVQLSSLRVLGLLVLTCAGAAAWAAHFGHYWAFPVCFCAALGGIFALRGDAPGAFPRGFEAWRAAESSGVRTPSRFLAGLARFDREAARGIDARTLRGVYIGLPKLRAYLDSLPEEQREEAMQAIDREFLGGEAAKPPPSCD